jgi:hypothetical protein
MGNIVHEIKRYYATLDTANWDKHDLQLLQNKRIEYVIKHKQLGYCVKIYEHELENIRKNGTISLTIWPDGDSTTFVETYKVTGIYMETQMVEEI